MYQVPRHASSSTAGPIAALVLAMVMLLVFALSVTDLEQRGGGLIRQPLEAPAGLGL
jgi:hypothetical protein